MDDHSTPEPNRLPAVMAVRDLIPDLTVEAVRNALIAARGNISRAALELEKSRSQVALFICKYPELIVLRNDLRETIVDIAEDNIFNAVEKGDIGASLNVVATLGRNRGWNPKHEPAAEEERAPVRQVLIRRYTDEEMKDLRAAQSIVPIEEPVPVTRAANE